MKTFDVSYDYRCPFAKNIHLHLVSALEAGADFDVNFVAWTMSQGYKSEGAPDVWDDPERDAELLSLAVSVSIGDLQPERFLQAHAALFKARHEQGIRLVTMQQIEQALAGIDIDLDRVRADVESRRPHQVIGANFKRYEGLEAFGVPTFVVGNDATFVRYMTPPTNDPQASVALIDSIVTLIEHQPELNEFKHTRLPM